MATLHARLRSGACGASWQPPETAELLEDDDGRVLLRDPVARVVWNVSSSPFSFALDAAQDDALRVDLEMSAREAFDKAWKAAPEDEAPARPRTDDPRWSPLIEHGRIDVAGGAALRMLRRTAYQPGKEIVVGQLIVPTTTGHLDFWAVARATVTGVRESLVMATRDLGAVVRDAEAAAIEGGAAAAPGIASFPPQAAYDDPALDAGFPEHPLTLVRRAIGALCESVTITRPAPRLAELIQLEEPRCAFAAPPRYLAVPPEVLRMHPTLRILMRAGIESWHRNLEVWRLDDVVPRRRDPENQLCDLARDTVAGWARQGATGIETDVAPIAAFDGRPQVQQSVNMIAEDTSFRTIFRWWIEPDGIVFRLGSSGPPIISDAEHVALLEGVQRTWRRLDAVGAARRPWWRVW